MECKNSSIQKLEICQYYFCVKYLYSLYNLVDILPDNTLIQSPLIKLHNRTVWSALPLKIICSIVTNFTQWTYDQQMDIDTFQLLHSNDNAGI